MLDRRCRHFQCLVACLLVVATACAPDAKPSPDTQIQRQGTTAPDRDTVLVGRRTLHGIDVQANTCTNSSQDAVAFDHDLAGEFVVTWQSRRQESGTYGVFARRFDAAGRPLSQEVHVNAFTRGMQMRPVVALGPGGEVWFAWESFGQDGDQGAIIARNFAADLQTATGETLVNAVMAGHQSEPTLVATPDGGAIVAWSSTRDGEPTRIFARRLAPDAQPLGPPVRVDTGDEEHDRVPAVALTGGGGFVVVWARSTLEGDPVAIMGRGFDSEGSPIGGPVTISQPDGNAHIEPTLAGNGAGQFLVGWMTYLNDEAHYVMHVRPLDAEGGPAGPVRRIYGGDRRPATGLNVALRADGHYLAAWSVYGSGANGTDLFAQRFDPDGQPDGEAFQATRTVEGSQHLNQAAGAKRVAYLDDGRMAFAWSGFSGGDDRRAANITLWCHWNDREQLVSRSPVVAADRLLQPIDEAAAPYIPPTYDPDRIAEDRATAMAAVASESVEFGFLGLTATGWEPPDPHLAVGPDHIVLIVNGKIAFLTKDGTLTFQDQLEDSFGFWGELGTTGFVFDPEVIYDPHSERFMAMANERTDPTGGTNGDSMLLFAVSDDSDPNGLWHKYRFAVSPLVAPERAGGIDSPNIGVDADIVYLSADVAASGHVFLMLNKAEILGGGVVTPSELVVPLSEEQPNLQSFGLPVMHDDAPVYYMIEAIKYSSEARKVRIHALSDPLNKPAIETIDVATAPYRRPEQPPQRGTTTRLFVFDTRFWSCVFRNGSLWATHHITRAGGSPDDRVIQRWYQFDLNDWPIAPGAVPEVAQWGEIDPGGTTRTFFGAINVDENDNMGMVFSQSSPTDYIAIGRTGRLASDPPGTTRPIVTVMASTQAQTSNRWGDYGGIVVDPADDVTFWYHHEFRTSNWRTWVGTFSHADTEPPEIVAADPFDGYIDPRAESSDGIALDMGIDRLTLTFSERVVAPGGAPLDASAFAVSVTGGINPRIRGVSTSANPTVEILLRQPIPVQQLTTIEAEVEDLSGNTATCSVTYGFLPADINQDGQVSPLDLIQYRLFLSGVEEPSHGTVGLYLDINRDGTIVPLDLLRFRQLQAGTGPATKAWAGETLP